MSASRAQSQVETAPSSPTSFVTEWLVSTPDAARCQAKSAADRINQYRAIFSSRSQLPARENLDHRGRDALSRNGQMQTSCLSCTPPGYPGACRGVEALISEAALIRKLVLEGLRCYRLVQAIKRYQEGELDLSGAAEVAGLAIQEFMGELHRQGVDIYGPEQRLAEGIGALAEVCGASETLRRSLRPR
jgi:predicted HTH domain antitoxin